MIFVSKLWSFSTWIIYGIGAWLGHWIVTGVRAAGRRKPGEPPPVSDGGAFNHYRGK